MVQANSSLRHLYFPHVEQRYVWTHSLTQELLELIGLHRRNLLQVTLSFEMGTYFSLLKSPFVVTCVWSPQVGHSSRCSCSLRIFSLLSGWPSVILMNPSEVCIMDDEVLVGWCASQHATHGSSLIAFILAFVLLVSKFVRSIKIEKGS